MTTDHGLAVEVAHWNGESGLEEQTPHNAEQC